MTNNERVMAYIKKTFDIDHVSLSGFPLLPGGVIVRDRDGEEMLFYWDILENGIRWTDCVKKMRQGYEIGK
jgi:hypothetical protein